MANTEKKAEELYTKVKSRATNEIFLMSKDDMAALGSVGGNSKVVVLATDVKVEPSSDTPNGMSGGPVTANA